MGNCCANSINSTEGERGVVPQKSYDNGNVLTKGNEKNINNEMKEESEENPEVDHEETGYDGIEELLDDPSKKDSPYQAFGEKFEANVERSENYLNLASTIKNNWESITDSDMPASTRAVAVIDVIGAAAQCFGAPGQAVSQICGVITGIIGLLSDSPGEPDPLMTYLEDNFKNLQNEIEGLKSHIDKSIQDQYLKSLIDNAGGVNNILKISINSTVDGQLKDIISDYDLNKINEDQVKQKLEKLHEEVAPHFVDVVNYLGTVQSTLTRILSNSAIMKTFNTFERCSQYCSLLRYYCLIYSNLYRTQVKLIAIYQTFDSNNGQLDTYAQGLLKNIKDQQPDIAETIKKVLYLPVYENTTVPQGCHPYLVFINLYARQSILGNGVILNTYYHVNGQNSDPISNDLSKYITLSPSQIPQQKCGSFIIRTNNPWTGHNYGYFKPNNSTAWGIENGPETAQHNKWQLIQIDDETKGRFEFELKNETGLPTTKYFNTDSKLTDNAAYLLIIPYNTGNGSMIIAPIDIDTSQQTYSIVAMGSDNNIFQASDMNSHNLNTDVEGNQFTFTFFSQ